MNLSDLHEMIIEAKTLFRSLAIQTRTDYEINYNCITVGLFVTLCT